MIFYAKNGKEYFKTFSVVLLVDFEWENLSKGSIVNAQEYPNDKVYLHNDCNEIFCAEAVEGIHYNRLP